MRGNVLRDEIVLAYETGVVHPSPSPFTALELLAMVLGAVGRRRVEHGWLLPWCERSVWKHASFVENMSLPAQIYILFGVYTKLNAEGMIRSSPSA